MVPDGFHRPQSDMEVERLIRDKYDKKKYIAKDWKPSLNKPDVAALGIMKISETHILYRKLNLYRGQL